MKRIPGITKVSYLSSFNVPPDLPMQAYYTGAVTIQDYFLTPIDTTDATLTISSDGKQNGDKRTAKLQFSTDYMLHLYGNTCFVVETADGYAHLIGCHERAPRIDQTNDTTTPDGSTRTQVTVTMESPMPIMKVIPSQGGSVLNLLQQSLTPNS
ncbi:MAG: hypothetical protein IJS00_04335 [Paludibacteraceae bacterium]|nr:hypothetical protein [Paludibacteraceae bacterium]